MAFFDDIGKKISKAGQNTIQKTKDMAGVSKINSLISEENNNINNNYYQIGKLYFSLYSNNCEEPFKNMVASIINSQNKITEYNKQLELIRGFVKCEKCGGNVTINSAFCNFCGNPMPKLNVESVVKNDVVRCSNCGKAVKKGNRFCTSCGTTIAQNTVQPIPTPTVTSNVIPVAETAAYPITGLVNETLTQPVNEPIAESAVGVPIKKKCPVCNFKITDDETIFCNFCGAKLVEESANTMPLHNEAPENNIATNYFADVSKTLTYNSVSKKCSSCGYETTAPEMMFCVNCGSRLK